MEPRRSRSLRPRWFTWVWPASFDSQTRWRLRGDRVSALVVLFVRMGLSLFAEPKNARRTTTTNSSGAVSNDSYMGLSGEELWSNNCMRCHNLRPPTTYSNAQWDVIVHHMRLRANITGQEQRAIVEFLKSSK